MFTRAIFIRPDSELIRESVCACVKLFVDEESTWHKSNRRRTKTLTDSIIPVNPPPFRGSLPRKSLIARMD
jgi:hypothetical protein